MLIKSYFSIIVLVLWNVPRKYQDLKLKLDLFCNLNGRLVTSSKNLRKSSLWSNSLILYFTDYWVFWIFWNISNANCNIKDKQQSKDFFFSMFWHNIDIVAAVFPVKMISFLYLQTRVTLHKKCFFPLRISSVIILKNALMRNFIFCEIWYNVCALLIFVQFQASNCFYD